MHAPKNKRLHTSDKHFVFTGDLDRNPVSIGSIISEKTFVVLGLSLIEIFAPIGNHVILAFWCYAFCCIIKFSLSNKRDSRVSLKDLCFCLHISAWDPIAKFIFDTLPRKGKKPFLKSFFIKMMGIYFFIKNCEKTFILVRWTILLWF